MLYTHGMATLLRQEGDYTYWSDGAQRYAKDNSLGKQAGGLAKRHPKASMPWASEGLGLRKAKADGANGKVAQLANKEERRKSSLRSLQAALLLHPDSATEQDGLRLLWEARVEQAGDSEGGSAAVKSHKMLEDAWSGTKQDDRVIDARQVHITISPGVEQDQKRLVHNLLGDEVVDDEG